LQLDHVFSFSVAIMAIIAFSGATHDIAADGMYLNELNAKQQRNMLAGRVSFIILPKYYQAVYWFTWQVNLRKN
jgi:MFS transporter, PAT family, beta-lactamase induction signal transducer AmpG